MSYLFIAVPKNTAALRDIPELGQQIATLAEMSIGAELSLQNGRTLAIAAATHDEVSETDVTVMPDQILLLCNLNYLQSAIESDDLGGLIDDAVSYVMGDARIKQARAEKKAYFFRTEPVSTEVYKRHIFAENEIFAAVKGGNFSLEPIIAKFVGPTLVSYPGMPRPSGFGGPPAGSGGGTPSPYVQ